MLNLTWIKSTANEWLWFETFDLGSVGKTTGVYVIWHGGQTPRTVRVGQGNIVDRITAHRGDQQILAYRSYGGLVVTWAAVPAASLDGVERHLADQLLPLVGDRHPNVVPIPVNLPWAA
jgi:hypothetical protein